MIFRPIVDIMMKTVEISPRSFCSSFGFGGLYRLRAEERVYFLEPVRNLDALGAGFKALATFDAVIGRLRF